MAKNIFDLKTAKTIFSGDTYGSFTVIDGVVSLRPCSNPKGVTHIRIVPLGRDTYAMTFYQITSAGKQIIASLSDVSRDSLRVVCETNIGIAN